jgi:hypothetical protein
MKLSSLETRGERERNGWARETAGFMDCASGEEAEGVGRGNWVASEGRERLCSVELVLSRYSPLQRLTGGLLRRPDVAPSAHLLLLKKLCADAPSSKLPHFLS